MISVENVRLRFDPRGIAGLSGVSFTLHEGSITALMGPNGSGKTTLLRILAGLQKPDSGKVHTESVALLALPPELPSEVNVQKHLIAQAPDSIPEEKKIQLSRDLADIFEFTFQLRQNLGQLSAGQKQKVLLAGELIKNPRLVLLDEPFAHLDPHTRKDILKSLFEYVRRQNLTLLWVTHEMNEAARFSDRILLLQHGKIEQDAAPSELITRPRNIFVAQFVGYHNFFPVKKRDGKWVTPWGEEEFAFPAEEAILVVPDAAWRIVADSPMSAQIQEAYFTDTLQTFEALWGEKLLRIKGHFPSKDPGEKLLLLPDFKRCFLIGL